ncbi:MAG: 50S ribosomal protein L24 [Candidatus Micrarchaeia archaeon]
MMIESGKPRKQRRYRFSAPLHAKQHFLHAHISKELREKLKLSKRAIQVAKGDSVKVVSGGNSGKEGKVTRVDLRNGFVYIDAIKRKNAKGKELDVPIRASNVYITDLNLSDKIRAAKIKRFQK